MAFAPIQWAQDNPMTAVAIGGVVVIGAIYIMMSGDPEPAPVAGTGVTDSQLAYAAQQDQTQAQITAKRDEIQGSLSLNAQENAYNMTRDKLEAEVALSGQAYQYQIEAGSTAGSISIANISAQLGALQTVTSARVAESTTAAQVDIQRLLTDAQITVVESNNQATTEIARINAMTQQLMSTNQSQVTIQQSADQKDAILGISDNQRRLGEVQSSNQMWGSMINGVTSAIGSVFSDSRMKENIVRVGMKNGFPLYEFNYYGDTQRYRGVMAEDVQAKRPDAIINGSDGFMKVDYRKIGIRMRKVA